MEATQQSVDLLNACLHTRLSYTYCYLLQDIFTAEMALLHFSVPMIHRPLKQLLHIGVQCPGSAKLAPEANIAIGTNQKQPSMLDFIALVQFACEVMQDTAGLLLRSRGDMLCDQVRL